MAAKVIKTLFEYVGTFTKIRRQSDRTAVELAFAPKNQMLGRTELTDLYKTIGLCLEDWKGDVEETPAAPVDPRLAVASTDPTEDGRV